MNKEDTVEREHEFTWQAHSMDCSVCGEAHSGCKIVRAASTPEAAGRADEWAKGVRDALREVQAERLEKHEQYLMVDPALQDGDAAYSNGIRDAERAIEKLLHTAGAPPSGEQASTPEAAGRGDGWIPVADGLPKHGGQVEITFWLNEHNGPFVTLARHEKGRWDWNSVFANAHRRDEDVTAWRDLPRPYQPKNTLPAPPSEAKAKEGVDDDPR